MTEIHHHNVTLLLSLLWGEFSLKMNQNWSDNVLEKVHDICELRALLLMTGKRPLGIAERPIHASCSRAREEKSELCYLEIWSQDTRPKSRSQYRA